MTLSHARAAEGRARQIARRALEAQQESERQAEQRERQLRDEAAQREQELQEVRLALEAMRAQQEEENCEFPDDDSNGDVNFGENDPVAQRFLPNTAEEERQANEEKDDEVHAGDDVNFGENDPVAQRFLPNAAGADGEDGERLLGDNGNTEGGECDVVGEEDGWSVVERNPNNITASMAGVVQNGCVFGGDSTI